MDWVRQGRGRDLPRPRERGVAPDLASAGLAPGLRAVAAALRKGPRPEGVLTMASQRPRALAGAPALHLFTLRCDSRLKHGVNGVTEFAAQREAMTSTFTPGNSVTPFTPCSSL